MKWMKWFTMFLIIIFFTTGCKTVKKEESKIQKIDKAPDSLASVSEGIQDILKDIEKIEKVLDGTDTEDAKAKVKEKEEEKEAQKEQPEGSDKKESEEKPNTQDKSEEEPKNKDEKLLTEWEKVDKKIEEVHGKWNTSEAEAMKKGATADKIDKFGESLNALTKSIEVRNIEEIYDFGSQSMLNLRPMFDLYMDEIRGDINKLKYITYQSYLKAIKGNPTKGLALLKESEEDIQKIRLKLKKKDSKIEILDKVNLSMTDMEKSLSMGSKKLIRIKKDIIIKNLEELEK